MTAPPPTTTISCRAPLLFAQMRAASGGTAWNSIGETTAFGAVRLSGLDGVAAWSDDRRSGRYAHRYDLAVVGRGAEVFDGTTVWSQDISGGVHPYDAAFARRRAVTAAYLARRDYLAAGAGGATVACAGSAREAGRAVTRLRVRPHGGIPALLSVDVASHLLTRVEERLPTTSAVSDYGDYRQNGDVVLPFAIAEWERSEPANGAYLRVRRYVLRARPRDGDFQRPVARNRGRMLGGAAATTVPIRIEGRQLLVSASIDGHAPMPFILDTGGHAILTTGAAKALGLRASGAGVSGGSGAGTIALQFAPVRSLRIGGAELRDQRFLVIPYPFSFYERGLREPLAGILGLEVFERFAVRIDYGRLRATLTPLASYAHLRGGASVPIRFQEDMPLAPAAADGHAGTFGVDTGNAGSVILFDDFLRRTGLARAYRTVVRAEGHGTGGSNTGRIVMLERFSFGGRTFEGVPSFLTAMRSGSFSSWTESGNLGYEILSRFVPTFDYARETLYLDASPYAHAPRRNRAGLAVTKNAPDAIDVLGVRPNSPAAAAEIAAGDRIVEVDGRAASRYSAADVLDMLAGKPGTAIRLRVAHTGTTRDVVVRLR